MAFCYPILVDTDIPWRGDSISTPYPGQERYLGVVVGTPPISSSARQGAKREIAFFLFLFFSFLSGYNHPLEAGLERRGVDTPVTPPTQSRPTARVAVVSQVNTYLGNILALCLDWVKGIFHLDPMDMMHKGGGDPAYFLLSWARQKFASNISGARAAQAAGLEWSGVENPLSTPHPQPARHALQMSVYMVYSAIQGWCRWA